MKRLETENSDLKTKLPAVPTENPEPEQKTAPGVEFPEPAELLNQLKAKMKADRKKSTASLADVESILEILEES
ncbi:MAG: flagellar alpha dynein [Cyanobacteriota bacterium]|nr:flagellar alpha dynein [Cyanobacteriota bacterium]